MQHCTAFSNRIEDYPDGIVLVVNKPYRWTSADVIRKVKWLACRHFGKKNLKVGHAGTLDPLATGVLLVCIGNATKRAEELQSHDKEYIAGVCFGASTASYDLEKEIDCRFSTTGINEESVGRVLENFIGEQEQIAPLFSAKSIDGVRAYEIARKLYKSGPHHKSGESVGEDGCDLSGESSESGIKSQLDAKAAELIRTARIRIEELELLSFSEKGVASFAPQTAADYSGMNEEEIKQAKEKDKRINLADISGEELPLAEIRIRCSKGTYIRALARDLGEALDSGAFLKYLIRSRSGDYSLNDAIQVSALPSMFPYAK